MKDSESGLTSIDFIKISGGWNDYLLIKTPLGKEGLSSGFLTDLAQRLCPRRSGVGAEGIISFIKNKEKLSYEVFAASPRFSPSFFPPEALLCASRFLFDSGEFGKKPVELVNQEQLYSIESVDSQNFRLELAPPTNGGRTADWNTPLIHRKLQNYSSVDWSWPFNIETIFTPGTEQDVRLKALKSKKIEPKNHKVFFSVFQKDLLMAFNHSQSWNDQCYLAASTALTAHLEGLSNSDVLINLNGNPFFVQIQFPGPRLWVTAPIRYLFTGTYALDASFFP